MFPLLARFITKKPWHIITAWVLLVTIALIGTFQGFGGKNLFQRLHSDAVATPNTQSEEVFNLTKDGKTSGSTITMVVHGIDLVAPDKAAKAIDLLTQERSKLIAMSHVTSVVDPLSLSESDPRRLALTSRNSDGIVALITLSKDLDLTASEQAQDSIANEIARFNEDISAQIPNASASAVSTRVLSKVTLSQVQSDLVRGESVGLPIALFLMVLVFGGIIAAFLPLLGAFCSIALGMFGLWIFSHLMTLESFILNIISLLGLALSIDYGLLVVSRFREEAHAELYAAGLTNNGLSLLDKNTQHDIVIKSVRATVCSAGRTISFSALTIACAIAGLLLMLVPTLRSIGLSGVLIVIIAVLGSISLVPALLVILGTKLLKPSPITRIPGLRAVFKALSDTSSDEGFFSRLARGVHRHPWSVMSAILVLLTIFCLPLSTLMLRTNFSDHLPKDSPARAGFFTLQKDYPALATPTMTLIVNHPAADTGDISKRLSTLPKVSYISTVASLPSDPKRSVIDVTLDLEDPVGKEAIAAVKEVRNWGDDVIVGGSAAAQIDLNKSVLTRAPLAASVMIFSVFILLFLMTGSIIVPIKALLINMLSLFSSLGATWFLFHNGLFGLPQTKGMETFVVSCAITFGFGLAMDYEVFLLARIKEYWDAGLTNDAAVEQGIQRSGRIITSAAAIIIAVFLGFVSSNQLSIKEIGVALALVVFIDATLVRMLLVPATMTLLGRWNWWAPTWLKRIYHKFGIIH
ncbi:MAG: MMPL family transporter [Propionibacteriaceae bacterium]